MNFTIQNIISFGLLGLSILALLATFWYAAWVMDERLIPWLRCWLGIADVKEYEMFEKFAEMRKKKNTKV